VSPAGQERLEVLRRVLDAFNRHDLDAIMEHVAEDCVFEAPRGPEPWGSRFVGRAEVPRARAAGPDGLIVRKDGFWKIREA
jgi:ketosteroid isomerase-like protein